MLITLRFISAATPWKQPEAKTFRYRNKKTTSRVAFLISTTVNFLILLALKFSLELDL